MTLLLRPDAPDWPWWLAMAVALLVTTAIGLLQALVITKAGVPSFVVTLAGLLIWSGVVLILTTEYSTAGTIRIQDDTVIGIANNFLSDTAGWIVGGVVVVRLRAVAAPDRALAPRAAGSTPSRLVVIVLQVVGLAVVTFGAVWYVNRDRGVPQVTLLVLALFVFWSFVASRTGSGGTSTRWAAALRLPVGPASTSTGSGSRSS